MVPCAHSLNKCLLLEPEEPCWAGAWCMLLGLPECPGHCSVLSMCLLVNGFILMM